MSDIQYQTVSAQDAQQRLDRWFQRYYPELPQSRLQKLLRTGQIRVDGKRAKAGLRLEIGHKIRVPPIKTGHINRKNAYTLENNPVSQLLLERILYMDENVIAINKPAGLAVQGGSRTLQHIDGMLDIFRFGSQERPKLVHRLDKDTSGVMVLARSAVAARSLARSFANRDTNKIYWAITVGVPERGSGRIDLPLLKNFQLGRDRVSVDRDEGKRAITDFRVLECAGKRLAWLALCPRTGRTHQVRVHCAAIGCPILGDGKYGGRSAFVKGLPVASKKLQLLARELLIRDIASLNKIRIIAPLPPHMNELWRMLEFNREHVEEPYFGVE